MKDEFFIGWQGKAPERTGKFLKRLTLAVLVVALGLGVALPALQETVAKDAKFDYGNAQEFSGILIEDPVPMLVGDDKVVYLLVNPFKFGFDSRIAAEHHLQHVSLKGTRIHRGGHEMIEALPESVKRSGRPATTAHPLGTMTDRGEVTLRGEIVDSKCYLGVMNPGNLKPHRACAINCIQGGVPPVLLVHTEQGPRYVLLVGEEGESLNADLLDLVAVPVIVTGRLKRLSDQLILFADPAAFSPE